MATVAKGQEFFQMVSHPWCYYGWTLNLDRDIVLDGVEK